ncbi:ribonuclease H-like domain-containing protein [Tanacetum coccineum]
MNHPSPKRNMVPNAILMRSGLVSLTTARPVNTAQPITTVNSARPMINRVNTVKDKNVNTARPKAVVNTARPKAVLNDVKGNQDKRVIDSGCSSHMTGNMSYLTDYEEIDGGYVAFGGNPKGGKITRKATKDETSGILKSFITRVENLIDQRVKVIRYDNGTEFRNKEMNQFCERKGIKREFNVDRTPQQNRVAERKNRTLIEAARTMLADSKLPTTFWAEVVNTACYVQNRINLGKFDVKAKISFVVTPINSKAFRVFNSRTRIVKENLLHCPSMNYKPVVVGNQSNGNACTKACDDAGKARMEIVPGKDYILLPLRTADPPFSQVQRFILMFGFKPFRRNDEKKVY